MTQGIASSYGNTNDSDISMTRVAESRSIDFTFLKPKTVKISVLSTSRGTEYKDVCVYLNGTCILSLIDSSDYQVLDNVFIPANGVLSLNVGSNDAWVAGSFVVEECS